jgi:hypothetical protein
MVDVSRPSDWFRQAVALACRQWGVVTVAQLCSLGVPRTMAESWVRHGRLIRLYRGVYAVGHDVMRNEGRWLAAVLACGEGAALSYAAAAALHGLRASRGGLIDVSVPRDRRAQRGIRLHRSRRLAGDITTVQGLPVTTPTRTLIDLARVLRPDDLESVAAQAQRRGLIDYARIDAGAPLVLRKLVGRGPVLIRARIERKLRSALIAAGLPEPEMNAWLTHGGGEQWQPDMLFRRQRVIVELDDDSHKTTKAFELDRLKDTVRQADGWLTPRYTLRRVDEDLPGVLANLGSLLTRAAYAAR